MTPLLCGSRSRRVVVLIAICATAATLDACTTNTAFERLTEARRLSAELLIRFTQASNAANQAVMADTDEASVAFAKQAEESKQTVEKNAGLLRSLLQQLNYSDELGFLETFTKEFAAYRDLDGRILELAVENTNLKAQRLSFGEAQQAADAFTESLNAVANGAPANDAWRVKALVAGAVADLRAIQVAQAPHIAEADDAVMTRIEQRMKTSETAVRSALDALGPLARPAGKPRLAAARMALDRFIAVNAQIVDLSRRNTNVRSLMLSLNEKGKVTSACEKKLRSLQDALSTRGGTASR